MASSKKFPGARLDLHDAAPEVIPVASSGGGEAPLSQFVEDAGNPRHAYDSAQFEALVESVRRHGVITAVTAYPREDGTLQLVTGHRRLRAAKVLGLSTLRWTLAAEAQRNIYVQFEENARRDDIEPRDKAQKIKDLIDAGSTRKDIGAQIGVDAAGMTHLLGLLELPPFLKSLYDRGVCRQPKYLYDLRKLHEKHPTLVEGRCRRAEAITGAFIAELICAANETGGAAGSKHRPRAEPVRRTSRLASQTAATPINECRMVYEGRVARIRRAVVVFDDGTEREFAGADLQQLLWPAAAD